MTNALAKLDKATQMLAEAKSLNEIKNIMDIAEAARTYARAAKLGLEAYNHAAEVKARAERKAGEFLAKLDHGQEGRPSKLYQPDKVSEFKEIIEENNIPIAAAYRWQQVAEMPELVFEKHLEEMRGERPITTSGMIKELKTEQRTAARAVIAQAGASVKQNEMAKIINADFRKFMADMPENSIDLIFTDPPYDEESIPLYEDMARLAKRVLKPGGSLITYVGHYAIIKAGHLMENHLRFWWTIALEHSGNSARLPGKWVFVGWKPLLWFVKDGRNTKEFVADIFKSQQPTKNEHEWQQDVSEAQYYIQQLCPADGIVLDPFAGSGTTLIAAIKLGRQSIGIEIDTDTANIANKRIHDYKS